MQGLLLERSNALPNESLFQVEMSPSCHSSTSSSERSHSRLMVMSGETSQNRSFLQPKMPLLLVQRGLNFQDKKPSLYCSRTSRFSRPQGKLKVIVGGLRMSNFFMISLLVVCIRLPCLETAEHLHTSRSSPSSLFVANDKAQDLHSAAFLSLPCHAATTCMRARALVQGRMGVRGIGLGVSSWSTATNPLRAHTCVEGRVSLRRSRADVCGLSSVSAVPGMEKMSVGHVSCKFSRHDGRCVALRARDEQQKGRWSVGYAVPGGCLGFERRSVWLRANKSARHDGGGVVMRARSGQEKGWWRNESAVMEAIVEFR